MAEVSDLHHIVVVGGGAGGLELVTRLGDTLGKRRQAHITLIDANMTHIWKPLLHEVAVGTMDSHEDDLDYLAHARAHHFRFRLGRMDGLDRAKREITLAPVLDGTGQEVIPRRTFRYDTLVLAVGSVSNDFGIPGVREHCMYLDTRAQADRVQQRLLNQCLQVHAREDAPRGGELNVAIVGAGATGVELAAELHKATRHLVAYGLDRIDPEVDVRITVIEAAPRVLPALPERLSQATREQLQKLGVSVLTGEQVTQVTPEGIHTKSGKFVPAELKVWSAGIKAPDFLRDLDGLESARGNTLVVEPTLRTTRDENIFALGDCAFCSQPGSERPVPPRAQSAHQQAKCLADNLRRRLQGRPLKPFIYKDYGSLVSLSYSSVGNIMGNLLGSVMIEGKLARMAYISLYKKHQLALHGWVWVVLVSLSSLIEKRTKPRLKLH